MAAALVAPPATINAVSRHIVCLSKIRIDNNVSVYCELTLTYLFGGFAIAGVYLDSAAGCCVFYPILEVPANQPERQLLGHLADVGVLANVRCASEPTRRQLLILQMLARRANQ